MTLLPAKFEAPPPGRSAAPRPKPCGGCEHKWSKHDGGFGRCRETGCSCSTYQGSLVADARASWRWEREKLQRVMDERCAGLRERAAKGDRFAAWLLAILTDGVGALSGNVAALASLGLDHNATREQVVAAFRERALRAHPDHGGTAEQMQELLKVRDAALAAVSGS